MLWIDLETYSENDIKSAGTYEYARTAEILLIAYAFDDGPAQLWDCTQTNTVPRDLFEALENPQMELTAHNAMFDRAVLAAQGYQAAGDPARWTCTMCNAYLHGFTGSLDKLSGIFGLESDQAKIKDGNKLINRFCKPAPKNHKADRYTAKTHPVEWERFCDYAKRDIVAMRVIANKLPSWNYDADEYRLDQTINDRGFQVDFELAKVGRRAAIVEKEKLAARFVELTNGDVASPTQRALFLAYLNERFGLKLENTQRATLEPLLKNDIDPVLAELIDISINANKTSTSKYAALIPAMSPDGRFRGGLQYSGASRTRRWCLTGEHEVLTNDGWLRLDEWTGGVIAQWCNGNIVFDQADRVVFDYQGEVLSVHRKGRIDAVMTPEHVLCATGQTGRQTAGSAFGRHVTGVERYGVLRRKPISTIRTRILVMLQHDGYVAGSTVEWNFVKKRKSTRCQKLLACAGIRFTASQKANGVYRIHIPVGAKPNWLVKRDFGPWLLQEKHCPRAFIDEIGHWDGGNRRDKQIEVCAKAKVNAEWTVTMAHLAGFSGTLSRRANGYWFANISKSGNRASIKPADWSLKHHRGKVYCAATRTGYFLTRRNGVIHVTGNSGRTFQPQNLPSHDAPSVRSIENYIDALKHDCHDFLFDGDLMRYGSHALRGVLIAPPGQKLCVADLANIEGRANAWLAGEMWKLKAFEAYDQGDGPDLYKVAAGKILGKHPNDVTKGERNSFGKITELALGYQGGVGAVQNFASNRGVAFADHWGNIKRSVDPALIDRAYYNYETWGHERAGDLDEKEWIASETVKLSWRAGHPAISRLWYECENAALDAMNNPGGVFSAGWTLKFRYVRYNDFNYLLMRMPSKRALVYFQPSIDHEGKITYWGVDSVTKQWKRQGIYGGKFCIAEDAPVLTDIGWLPIQKVTRDRQIWDGKEWVLCDGVIYQGHKKVIEAHGVQMTPDHLVLTVKGWRRASQSKKYNRVESRIPNGGKVSWERWEEIPLAGQMRLRKTGSHSRHRIAETKNSRRKRFMWLQTKGVNRQCNAEARHVKTSTVCGMARDEGPVCRSKPSSLEKLRWARDICLYRMGGLVRSVFEGHAAIVSTRTVLGANRQLRRLFGGQLLLGYSARAEQQHPKHNTYRHPQRSYVNFASGAGVQYQAVDVSLPDTEQSSSKSLVCNADKIKPVYDLINCGPRNRFVVRDKNGHPLIVHNCENACQSLSRDILVHGMFEAEKRGYRTVLTVHDEVVTECPDNDDFTGEKLADILASGPAWCAGFPLAAEGFESYRYRK